MNLVSFGDSFPSGYGVSAGASYPARAAVALGCAHIQRALSGSKVGDVAAAIGAIAPAPADIYTVGVGLNDARDNGVGTNGVRAFYSALLSVVTYLAVVPGRVFLFTPSLQTWGGAAGYTAAGGTPEATESFADAVRQVAARTGVQLIDAYSLVNPATDLMDGCHWLDTTHYRVADRIVVRMP